MTACAQLTPEQIAPNSAAALHQQGKLLQQRGDHTNALAAYGQAIAQDQSFWPAWLARGDLKLETGDLASAMQDLSHAVEIAPDQARIWLILGNACSAAGQSEQALACFQQATTLDPGYAEAYYNIGVIRYHRDELDAAVEGYAAALTHKPDFILAQSNLGIALEAQGDTIGALAQYNGAIATDPNNASVRWNKALMLLRNSEYAEGWKLYEWRWSEGTAGPLRNYPGRPLWLGGIPIAGRTILLYAEQGLGDTIQFARYVKQVEAAGARVVLQVFPPLKTLFEAQPGAHQVIGVGEPLPAFDLQCPLMSLPLALGNTFDAASQGAPYIVPDPALVTAWKERLGTSSRLRVGLVWKGNPKNPTDALRSIPLDALTEVLGQVVEFVCLQQDATPTEVATLRASGNAHVFDAELGDFNDTAALVACCDLVITVDTAMAHLAGAMGKPTWVLLAARSDWRWLKDQTDSPWYPSARLFRQAQQGVWQDVVEAVQAALADHLDRNCSGT